MSEIATPQPQPPWVPGIFTGTEQWASRPRRLPCSPVCGSPPIPPPHPLPHPSLQAALLNADDWGFGVISKFSQFNAGFHGQPSGGPTDDATGYIAPFSTLE